MWKWWIKVYAYNDQSKYYTYFCILAFRVRTLYDFHKTREDDLGFTENEIIVVQPFQDEDSEWWYGTNEETHQAGYFPKTYVEVIPLGKYILFSSFNTFLFHVREALQVVLLFNKHTMVSFSHIGLGKGNKQSTESHVIHF